MKKKLLIAGIFAIISFSELSNCQEVLTKEEIIKKSKEMLAKSNIEFLEYNEINIVPASKYINNKITQNKNDIYMAEKIKEYLSMNDDQQKNGYVKTNEPRAKELMNLKNIVPYHKVKYKDNFLPESTHIRTSIGELKMAYTFVGVPVEDIDSNIGIAPYGAYRSIKEGDDGDGWEGAVQFFNKKGLGVCAFTEHNRKLAHSGVELIKELVTYEINNKPTIALIKGNKKTGYLYKLKWYGATFSRELECVNPNFSKQLQIKVVALANHIEAYQ